MNSGTGFKNLNMCKTTARVLKKSLCLVLAGKCTNTSTVVCRLNSNTPETRWPPQFCSVCVASEVCILITVNFVQFEKKNNKKHTCWSSCFMSAIYYCHVSLKKM